MSRSIVRIYQWVSDDATEQLRQDALRAEAQALGYQVAATYSEKGPAAWDACPQLQRLLAELNEGDIILVEHLDHITQLPLDKVVALMAAICARGATVAIPGLLDLTHVVGSPAIVREAMQAMLLKVVLYQCRAHWEARLQGKAREFDLAG